MFDPITILVLSTLAGGFSGALAASDEPKKIPRISKGVSAGLAGAASTAAILSAANAAPQNQPSANSPLSSVPPWRNLPPILPPNLQGNLNPNNPSGGSFGGLGGGGFGGFGGGGC
ncbi:hypothetical protein [[Phormidium] sp. ETS-05]|uniref:hypothetical protein n=1 Tax=[Phormidium] sp. ETS-05 TaxID=222819 RepID=UPI0018EF0AC9|nr:hypothetical protein [[Phormidium] sp. ETS-05]